ncbi:MAG: DNA recombination protein RmuC [Prevotella sp.]|nr:DNA recombination protein RmuC [Prevotella sp.]
MDILFTIIIFVVGLLLGSGLVYILLNRRLTSVSSKYDVANTKLESSEEDVKKLETENESLRSELRSVDNELDAVTIDLERTRTLLSSEREHTSTLQQAREEQFAQQLKTVQEQFANLATSVLSQTTEKLKSENGDAMANITKPLHENLTQLSQMLERTNAVSMKNTASLEAQIKSMAEQTMKIDESANRLTNVLKGGNQVQGQWGEKILTDILDAQGFKLGVDYDVQQTLTDNRGNTVQNDETGRRMKPDVIVHYPNDEDVVIDAKMSIEAYYQYVNTTDETQRKIYADQLVKSIRAQMAGLAKKDYSSYVKSPRRAIDFVVMFVPNEGALQLALATDPKLWGEAFDKQVFITSQQNLMAMLKIIQMAWRQYAQNENQQRVYELADELLKRVGHFMQLFENIRKDMDALDKHYEDAFKKVFDGRQSIVQKANELKSLGAKENPKYPIPETILPVEEEQE